MAQGFPGPLPQAAESARRRRRQLLAKSEEIRYTPGTGFDMEQLQQTTDSIASCTQSVLCDSDYNLLNDAILDIYAINVELGAMAVCTGERCCFQARTCLRSLSCETPFNNLLDSEVNDLLIQACGNTLVIHTIWFRSLSWQ